MARTGHVAALEGLNWAGHVLLALGLFGPCMTITPRMKAHTGLARWLGLVDDPETYSILSGIGELLRGGKVVIGTVLLVFSVLFPVAKLVVLRAGLADARSGSPITPAHRIASVLGKYSMVDVFVIALLVVASQSFPGGTTITILWGTYTFAGAALLSTAVGIGLARLRRA
ncbi:MAG: paraquat-inducible protein A [Planctomycetota bacterium]